MGKGEVVFKLLLILDSLEVINYWAARKIIGYSGRLSYIERLARGQLDKR